MGYGDEIMITGYARILKQNILIIKLLLAIKKMGLLLTQQCLIIILILKGLLN